MVTDFSMYAGNTKHLAFAVVDEAGMAVDVTGAMVTFVIAPQNNPAPVITKSTNTNGVGVSSSTITVMLTPDDTAALVGSYRYELEIVDASGNVSTNQGALLIWGTLL